MKHFAVWLICICTGITIHAQSKPAVAGLAAEFPFIGQPVAIFKDSLLCKDASHPDKRYDEYPACKSFLVSPSTTVYRYGGIEFGSIILFPDSTGIVNFISHFKSFKKEEKKSRVDAIVALSRYFNAKCGMLPVVTERKGKYSDDQTLFWRKEGIKIFVKISYHKNRKKGQVSSILSLGAEKE